MDLADAFQQRGVGDMPARRGGGLAQPAVVGRRRHTQDPQHEIDGEPVTEPLDQPLDQAHDRRRVGSISEAK